jgi:hypothetical protein
MHNDCSVGDEIGGGPYFIGTVKVGSTNTISMELDQDADEVIFQLNDDAPYSISYAAFLVEVGGNDTDSPDGPYIDLRITAGGRTCGSDRESGCMEVTFDNVDVIAY